MSLKFLFLALAISHVSAIQIMLKNHEWYCFSVKADKKTKIDVDYMITGLNPERVNFEARQENQIIASKDSERSAVVEVSSIGTLDIQMCW